MCFPPALDTRAPMSSRRAPDWRLQLQAQGVPVDQFSQSGVEQAITEGGGETEGDDPFLASLLQGDEGCDWENLTASVAVHIKPALNEEAMPLKRYRPYGEIQNTSVDEATTVPQARGGPNFDCSGPIKVPGSPWCTKSSTDRPYIPSVMELMQLAGKAETLAAPKNVGYTALSLPGRVWKEQLVPSRAWAQQDSKPGLPGIEVSKNMVESLIGPYMTDDEENGTHDTEEKKLKRILSNRASAKRSRQRKQQQVDHLELEVARLRVENAGLIKKGQETANHLSELREERETLCSKVTLLEAKVERLLQQPTQSTAVSHDHSSTQAAKHPCKPAEGIAADKFCIKEDRTANQEADWKGLGDLPGATSDCSGQLAEDSFGQLSVDLDLISFDSPGGNGCTSGGFLESMELSPGFGLKAQ